MKIFPTLRALVRIAKAMEEANELKRIELGIKRPKRAKLVEFSIASVDEQNKRWRLDHPELEE